MKKLILLFILSFFSTQGYTASCPDGNEPIKTVSPDGTYYVYKCGINSNDDDDAAVKTVNTSSATNLNPSLGDVEQSKKFISKNISNDTDWLRDMSFLDTNSDANNEIFMCYSGYTNFPDIPMTVIETIDSLKIISQELFSGNIPTSNDCPHMIFEDLDGDGDKDLILAEAGMDLPPWTGTAIEVAINQDGKFERVTEKFEDQIYGIRSYATGAYYDQINEKGVIILSRNKILTLQDDKWTVSNNSNAWNSIWKQKGFDNAAGIVIKDLDGDGVKDMYVGGSWMSKNHTVFWGGDYGIRGNFHQGYSTNLPPSKLEFNKNVSAASTGIGGDVSSVAISDFDNDGDKDIMYMIEKIDIGLNFQISYDGNIAMNLLENKGGRNFKNHSDVSSVAEFDKYYMTPYMEDFNSDGLIDVMFPYWIKHLNSQNDYIWGSMLFMNKGNLKFEAIDMNSVLKKDGSKNGIVAPLRKTNKGWDVAIISFLAGSSKAGFNKLDQRIIVEKRKLEFNNSPFPVAKKPLKRSVIKYLDNGKVTNIRQMYGKWYEKQDNKGNLIHCNEASDSWSAFKFGSENWSDYSISLRMKFLDKGEVETQIRINMDQHGYRASTNSSNRRSSLAFYPPYDFFEGSIKSIEKDEWMQIKLTASGNNIEYFIDGQVVAKAKDSKRKKGLGAFSVAPNTEACVTDVVVNKI